VQCWAVSSHSLVALVLLKAFVVNTVVAFSSNRELQKTILR